ncbi:MAG: N-acetylmuramoyl-L-alanine amidase [Clostridiales bacterium]|uniref:N-acetylmuramoyl-L-alanine amidase family protein n=1 Tax=Terrisporobacter sp. TaxID=1965305 RepID=UPI002A4E6EFE|nr:N-acetylmuramoyl-L-alanine amidase [Terrisporobacter sp.]MDD7753712.1 N-acetylmuramoyl-L-alanine amidase [Clostridiales bacterium]MDY4134360.1 N-acetylmuramoyl-L-alanine amidase [Terrisporobacter sp.]
MQRKITLLFIITSILVMVTGCVTINLESSNEKETSKVEDVQSSEKNDSNKKQTTNKDESSNEDNSNKDNDSNEENSNITIVIDPGHSSTGTSGNEPVSPNSSTTKLKDGLGATGSYTNIPEHKTNMSVALLVKKELTSKGYNVILTKQDVAESKSNIERADVGNKNNADLVVRIHADSAENSSISGASMHVPANNEYTSSFYKISKSYGTKILNTYVDEIGIKNRGVIERNDLTGFNWSKVPVVLIEMGFLSNKEDDNFVSNTANHPKIAKAISDGIDKCFE